MLLTPTRDHLLTNLNKVIDLTSYGKWCAEACSNHDLLAEWLEELMRAEGYTQRLRTPVQSVSLLRQCQRFLQGEFDHLRGKFFFTGLAQEEGTGLVNPLIRDRLERLASYDDAFMFYWSPLIVDLAERFADYLHTPQSINAAAIMKWLSNFADHTERELALFLLSQVRYIRIREFGESCKRLVEQHNLRDKTAIVVLLGKQDKSMAEMEKHFQSYCTKDHALSYRKSLKETVQYLAAQQQEHTLLFVDDIVGSGQQMSDIIKEHLGLFDQLAYYRTSKFPKYLDSPEDALTKAEVGILQKHRIVSAFGAACESGLGELERFLSGLGLNWKVELLVHKTPLKKCFSAGALRLDGQPLFDNHKQRTWARSVMETHGKRLEPDHPLGFKDTQQLIVFSHKVPNNTLPILWKTASGWTPLFQVPKEVNSQPMQPPDALAEPALSPPK
jgi:hypothetical protein